SSPRSLSSSSISTAVGASSGAKALANHRIGEDGDDYLGGRPGPAIQAERRLTAGREAVDDAFMESHPPPPDPASPRPWPRRCALAAWAGWALPLALLWAEHRLGVLHPWSHLFLLLLALTFLAASAGFAAGLWRLLRGPGRRAAAAWALACLLPAGLWAAL